MTKLQPAPDTFLDRWGHWIFWMGPYILIVSLLAWTPRMALLLAGIELTQFTLHVWENHPEQPATPSFGALGLLGGVTMVVGMLIYPLSSLTFLLLLLQILFSGHIHQWIHSRNLPALGFITIEALTTVWMSLLIVKCQTTPGFPGLYAYLNR